VEEFSSCELRTVVVAYFCIGQWSQHRTEQNGLHGTQLSPTSNKSTDSECCRKTNVCMIDCRQQNTVLINYATTAVKHTTCKAGSKASLTELSPRDVCGIVRDPSVAVETVQEHDL